jgi:hypothetical protein
MGNLIFFQPAKVDFKLHHSPDHLTDNSAPKKNKIIKLFMLKINQKLSHIIS